MKTAKDTNLTKIKRTEIEEDPDWKNGIYIGPSNVGPVADLKAYREYAFTLAEKGKDFLTFSQWRIKNNQGF